MYKLINNSLRNIQTVSLQNEDGSITYIPNDEGNTDYQAYLKWLAEGNTPTPADEVTQ